MGLEQAIVVGARGWEHDDWAGHFYPADLPPDWRLTYYANWLRGVLVPGELWDGVDGAVVRTWAEDCDEAFRFVLELPAALSVPHGRAGIAHRLLEFFAVIEPIRARTAGLVLRVSAAHAPRLDWLDALLRALGEHFPLCVELPGAWRTGEALACLAQHHAALLWHSGGEPLPPGGRFLVALSREGRPRAQRTLLEQLAAWPGSSAALFFDTPAKAAVQARQARQLAELMQV